MTAKPQIIYEDDRPAFVVLPWEEYRVRTWLHAEADLSDEALADLARAEDEETFPADTVDRLLAGENAVRVFRRHRKLTQVELAEKAGIKPLYLSQIETGRRTGSIETLKSLAKALSVDLDDLV